MNTPHFEDTEGHCEEIDPEKTLEMAFTPLEFYAPPSVRFVDFHTEDDLTAVGPVPKAEIEAPEIEILNDEVIVEKVPSNCIISGRLGSLPSQPCSKGCIVCKKEVF